MPGFKGQADYSVDDKGRVALPAKMRRAMNPEANETFVVTRGLENCVHLYPLDRWEEMENEFRRLNRYKTRDRNFVRIIYRWADEVSLDGQGRLSIPKRLLEFAGITTKATIIGAMDMIEVWCPEVLEDTLNAEQEDYGTIAERVMGGLQSDEEVS